MSGPVKALQALALSISFLLAAIGATHAQDSDDAALRRGRIVFIQCKACHALKASAGHKVGPNLAGVMGAPIASKEGYAFSKALKGLNGAWTADALDRFLTQPSAFAKGTTMAFAGLKKPEDRAAVIAYLAKGSTPKK